MLIPDWEYVDEYRFTFKQPIGADPGAIYEFIYPAKDPVVYGLGFAAIRDVVSFLRYQAKDDKGNLNPLQPPLHDKCETHIHDKCEGHIYHNCAANIKKALAYGASQTGRIVKTFVYEGFNEDEKGRIVFDGINSHIGTSRKNWLNGQFSHPGDIFGNEQFPFTYAHTRDHFTGDVDEGLGGRGMGVRARRFFNQHL